MAVTDQQKIDFLLKKIGFTKTKTGSVVGTGAISGTGKQPFAEAIPSPLIIANGALWNESDSIPTTPPGSDTAQVKVYLAGTSGLRMTADSTSSGQRAFIAYTTYNDTSSARLTNWIDTQFGASYLIKVYKGDPNSGGVALSAAGSGANDGWFFDYSAGVLNFNDTSVPSGVTDTNIYIVGYRYIGLTGAPTPTGGGNFTFNDLVVSRNFQVAGLSTFNGLVDINAGGQANTFKVEDLTDNRVVIAGTGGELEDSANLTFDGSTLAVTGDATFSGNVAIGGTLTYEDVKNIDAVGLITARSGIRVTGGVIEAQAGENKIPSLYAAMGNLPSAGSYHGMFAHVHATGRGYFAHAGNWYELVNKEVNGVVGTGTERYNIGPVDLTTLDVSGISTFAGNIDINADIDVDGHTNLDNVSVAGVTTFAGAIDANGDLDVDGHTNLDNVSIAGLTTASEGIFIPDNKKAQFGNSAGSSDLEIYHNSVNSFVENTTGYLQVNSSIGVYIKAGGEHSVDAIHNGAVKLYYDHSTYNTPKLQTTATGITIDGTAVAGGLDISGDIDVDGHTNLDNVSVAGVTSIASLTSGRVVTAGTGGKLQDSNNLTFDGTNLFVSGINVTGGGTTSILGADIVTRNIMATGISTFEGNARFNSTITAGGSAGTNGQYLKTTGSGVEWASFPTMRTSQTFTASSGQTAFSFSYTVGFLDVFVNGVKLASSEFTATNGSTVVLAVGSFVGDIVELISYYTVSGGGGGGGGGISNVVEDTTPQLGGNLDLFNKSITGTGNVNITGIISATSFKGPSGVTATFVGDGSGLTNVIGSGSGVIIKDDNNVVGTAGTINFAENLSVTPISAGIVTVGVITSQFDVNKLDVSGISTFKGAIDVNADLDVDGHTNLDNVSIAGVVTATSFVGALTGNATGLSGNPSINVTDLDVDGHTNLDNVSVSGVTTFTGAISASDIRSNSLNLKNAGGSATYAIFTNGGSALLKHNNTDRLETSASGVTVTGTVAATSYTGDGSQLTGIGAGSTVDVRTNTLNVIGVSTLTNIDVDDFIDVGSNIQLGNAGVITATTFKGDGDFVELDVDGHTNLDNVNIAGVVTATSFVGDGSSLTGISAGVTVQDEGSALSTTATTLNFVGAGVVASGNGATKTITIAGGSSQDTFRTIAVAGQSDVVADSATDTLTLVAGSNMTITTNAGSDTITFASSGGGGGGTDVGITTNLSGSFTASAGTPATINTFAYHDNDKVVEYTVYIKNGSDFQSQKLLAMRDGTTIHSTQFAVMFSSSLLVQCDATISSGNILLRATPETGVSGSTTYKIKREVM